MALLQRLTDGSFSLKAVRRDEREREREKSTTSHPSISWMTPGFHTPLYMLWHICRDTFEKAAVSQSL